MASDPPALFIGKEVSPNAEIYSRNELGQMQKRLGVVGDLVPKLHCFQVTVVNQVNEERIIDAIRGLLEDRHLEAQKLRYEAIIDTFQSYVDTGLEDTLGRSHALCTEAAGSFYSGLEVALASFMPHIYQDKPRMMTNALAPLVTAADSYLVVLAIAFHSLTKRAPEAASREKVVIGKVNAAITLLERHLQRALLPLGRPKKSPMAALLFRGDEQSFLRYYPYCKGYEGQAGIVRMVGEANEIADDEDKRWHGHKVSSDIPFDSYLTFADTLILLMERFKALKAIRLGFDPNAGPLDDPRTILDQEGSDTPRIAQTTGPAE
ncbi:hypothetical protein Q7C30_015035 [Pseudomonas sp. RAC1]|uniref:hypothetical protein n=1 Tax=Pseudomonas sp. RAC1 TaxID=3064900 RepID=UPI002715E272|nr:hypothetical protein [Pseudomonas sp. RAC1]MDV9033405.1 hypothetical protein [Pseudomonas sp. RAC1]